MATDGSNRPTSLQMDTLLKACGISKAAELKYLKEDQGLRFFADWLAMEESDFRDISRTVTKLPTAPFSISVVSVKKLVALKTWINDQVLMGGKLDNIDVSGFKTSVIRDYIRIAYKSETANSEISKPDSLTDNGDWVSWRELFTAYLQTVTGEQGCSLWYIVRLDAEKPTTITGLTREQRIFWNAPHTGFGFEEDNKVVFQLLQSLLDRSASVNIIKTHADSQDGAAAWLDLSNLFDGEGEVTKRAISARSKLKQAKYANEKSKRFTTLISELTGYFSTLEKGGVPIADKEQVNILCDDILQNVTNTDIRNAMGNARNQYPTDFTRAANVISTAISRVSPSDSGGTRTISSTDTSVGGSTDWNNCDSDHFCNGVDVRTILDPKTPNLPPEQWNRIPKSFQIAISNERRKRRTQGDRDRRRSSETKRKSRRDKRRRKSYESDSTSSYTSSDDVPNDQRRSAASAFGGKRRKVKETNTDKIKSEFDPRTGKRICRLVSSARRNDLPPRVIRSIKEMSSTDVGKIHKRHSTFESDNHADTYCCGPNCIFTSFTGEVCDVSGYNNEINSPSIRVGTAITAWEDSRSGRVYLLEIHQALDMRNHINHTLMNPNQSRVFGIDVCDDPFDPHRMFGITIAERNIFIPFRLDGSTALFETRPPTAEEMESLFDSRITLTSEQTWNPKELSSHRRSIVPSYTKRIISEVISDDVQSLRRDVSISSLRICEESEEDAGLVNSVGDDALLSAISTGLTDETLLPRLVYSVNVSESTEKENAPPEEHQRTASPLQITLKATKARNRHSDISAESLAKKWRIGIPQAVRTLRRTTQQGIRQAIHPITRRYRTDTLSMRYRRLRATFYTDTVPVNVKSIRQHTHFQTYTSENFVHVHPMRGEKEAAQSLLHLAQDVGIPAELKSDNAPLLTGPTSDFVKQAEFLRLKLTSTEPYTQRHNLSEGEIRVLKRRWKNRMALLRVPKRLWCYALQYDARILSMTARGRDGIPGLERVTGDTCDITEWLDFSFYDRVWFENNPEEGFKIGRWLGVSHRVGSALCYYVLAANGFVLSRTTVQHIPEEDLALESVQQSIQEYDSAIQERLKDENFVLPIGEDLLHWDVDENEDDTLSDNKLGTSCLKTDDDIKPAVERDFYNDEQYDSLLSAEVLLPDPTIKGDFIRGTVIKRAKLNDGTPKGLYNKDKSLDSRRYIIRLQNGLEQELRHNEIAENLWAGADSQGRQYMQLDQIVDHRSDESAVKKKDGFIKHGSNLQRKKTTKGWEFLCTWKDKSQDWIPLKDLKECNPIEVTEYVKSHGLIGEPAFSWWCNHVLKVRTAIIDKVKSRYWKATHKYGFRMPKTVEEAHEIDNENCNTLWADAIDKEMKTVQIAFKPYIHPKDGLVSPKRVRQDRQKYLLGYTEIKCHLVFDIKLDGNFTRKARFVADGSQVDLPKSMTYSSVVSRESVRIAFLLASLNELEVSACDISGAYLNAPAGEKVWFAAGPECKESEGMTMVITRALYGTKSAAKAWKDYFQQSLEALGYLPCRADENVYMKPKRKPNGTKYWAYLLVYVDDCLAVDHMPNDVMEKLMKEYKLKNDEFGEPKRYLGANVGLYELDDNKKYWSMSAHDYLQQACKTVRELTEKEGRRWISKRKNVMIEAYRPECDVSNLLGDELSTRYMQLIGILRWGVELGRIDIITEVTMLSSYNCSPREGHLEALYQIFEYVHSHLRSTVVFDSSRPTFDYGRFTDTTDWKKVYGEVTEEIPDDLPEARGNPIDITMFVDAAHAGNLVNRRSHTGIIIFLNMAPITWYSKRQGTVEASTFGSEFVALRVGMEMNEGLRYKLRMMGVPISGPSKVLCDNKAVVDNASLPESQLKKKHLSIAYHYTRECCAKQAATIAFEPTETNLADLCTKVLGYQRRRELCKSLLY